MIHDNMEFHNIAELRTVDGKKGLLMQRVPEEVRLQIRQRAQEEYIKPASVEIRFVSKTYPIRIKLYNYGDPETIAIYFGDFQKEELKLDKGANTLEIDIPERIQQLIPDFKSYTYHPGVARIIFHGINGVIHYIEAEGEGIRPPLKAELPSARYLAYGTSITHGMNATSPVLSYAAQTAWRLGAELINLGTSASAFCEDALAGFIASREDWDYASLCISVNMLNQGVSAEDFKKAAFNFIKEITVKHPEKYIFCISIFPYYRDYGFENLAQTSKSTPEEFRGILKQVVKEISSDKVIFIEGRDLLDTFGGLTTDLIHPGNFGMIGIGENLARIMSRYIK